MVIDALAHEFSHGKLNCDRDGRIAASGNVNRTLLQELLADTYYRRKPPKSAGREQYGTEFITRLRKSGIALRDLLATVTVLTAASIAIAVRRIVTGPADLIASGGGTHNPQIMVHLAGFLPGVDISTSTDHGIDADAKEAIAFAILAHETWRRKPSNLPSATGAKASCRIGQYYALKSTGEIAPAFPLSDPRLSFLRCRLLDHLLANPHRFPVVSELFAAVQTSHVSAIG